MTATAHSTYQDRRAEVVAALAALATHIESLDAREARDPRNWGFAGDLGHIAATLRTLVPTPSEA